ncbi:hypothetical protein [Methylobacterium sp. ID0610]|uniref:hypothetical protein n=1 Tax=Methylobacterium carpenticola TaxID=3344827 RepID=UPI0036C92F31
MTADDAHKPAELVRAFLANLQKAALTSNDQHSFEWRQEARQLRDRILTADPAALARLKIDGLWWLALTDAETPELRPEEGQIEFGQPKRCPFTLVEIAAPDFDVDQAVNRLLKSAATG